MAHEALCFVDICSTALRKRWSDDGCRKTQNQNMFKTGFHKRTPLRRDLPSAFPASRQYTPNALNGVRFRTTGDR